MPLSKEDLKRLQAEQLTEIAEKRLGVLQAGDELAGMGGVDDYRESLRVIVNAYPEGISLARIQSVLTDASLLLAARKSLAAEIQEIQGKKQRGIILSAKSEVQQLDEHPMLQADRKPDESAPARRR